MRLPINDYNNFEYCLTPDNPAIRQARKSMNAICIPRAERDDQEQELLSNLTGPMVNNKNARKEYLSCLKCTYHGIRKKYLKSTMLAVIRKTTRAGRLVTVRQYYCAECAKTYTPHSKRVGGKTY
jgi:hypothetical protein